MILRAFLSICILAISSLATAAEAKHSRTFYVNGEIPVVVEWIINNEDKVVKSTRCEIVSRRGDLVRVKKKTLKGTFEFTLRERMQLGKGEAIFSTNLVESHRGNLVKEEVTVTMTQERGRIKMVLFAHAIVNDRRISHRNLSTSLSISARGFENLMTSQF